MFKFKTIVYLVMLIFISSCVTNKSYIYLQDKSKTGKSDSVQVSMKVVSDEYKLKPGDILYIKLVTEDDKINNMFNPLSTGNMNMGMMMNNTGNGTPWYIMGYSLDKDGNLDLPYIGKLKLSGLNIDETRNLLDKQLAKYFKNYYLHIKLAEFRFTVLGRVNRPGQYFFNLNHINIFEALALAGDLNEQANRKNLVLMREVNGQVKMVNIDITDKNLIHSPYYYLFPNDVLYVQPIKSRTVGNLTTLQSSISTVGPILSSLLLLLNTYILVSRLN